MRVHSQTAEKKEHSMENLLAFFLAVSCNSLHQALEVSLQDVVGGQGRPFLNGKYPLPFSQGVMFMAG